MPGRTSRVGRVAAMHRLVQGQHEEALPVSGELLLPSFGRRLPRLVEVFLAQGLQKLQVLFAQLKIFFTNLGERWIRGSIGDRCRVLTKVLLPFCRGINRGCKVAFGTSEGRKSGGEQPLPGSRSIAGARTLSRG